jgi:ADP-ribose pyrophosphatase YjhB (NUDIX family)
VISANGAGRFRHEALAVVFKITATSHLADEGRDSRAPDRRLGVLAWRRSRDPYAGRWALPSGPVAEGETMGACVARHLATKVDLNEIAHLEQLETRSDPSRDPFQRTIATAYLGLVPADADPHLPDTAAWLDAGQLPQMAFDHASVIESAVQRLRSKLSYTNVGFALAPKEFTVSALRDLYGVALGHDISATNLQRVLQRRGQLEPTGATASSSGSGGRPAALFRFTRRQLEITDLFAAFRP